MAAKKGYGLGGLVILLLILWSLQKKGLPLPKFKVGNWVLIKGKEGIDDPIYLGGRWRVEKYEWVESAGMWEYGIRSENLLHYTAQWERDLRRR